MFLKSVEIRGFKSFADKTNLEFKKGISAVVGPNGSGKSNISDAVRWVLGEQSVKSLRGGKMEDVIFAGTQFRKSLGLAQVALTLDNTDGKLPIDYSDVTISRRLYRSGESEYYINNTLCRLKDVQELFMDTGIGKEGYSIIGQGKIEAILSGRPEERRSLLEEAAGIVKFKTRKEEAEKKLENTEQNLVRINDILSTYEDRLEPLRIENEKAKEFLKLSEELKIKEVNISINLIEKSEERIRLLDEEKIKLEEKVNELKLGKEDYRNELESLNKEFEEKEDIYKKQEKEYYENKDLHQKINAEINLLNERIENLTNFINKSSEELEELNSEISNRVSNKRILEEEFEKYGDQNKDLNMKVSEYEKKVEDLNDFINEEESLIKKLKEDQFEILGEISDVKNRILILKNEEESLKQRLSQLNNSSEGYINSVKININTKLMLEDESKKIGNKIKEYEEQIKYNREEYNRTNNKLQIYERKLKEANALYNKLEANHHMLQNLDKQYEGYNRATKALMTDVVNGKIISAKDNSFILGEVINVKEELETAIEIALGGAISDIITINEAIAKNLIDYLKRNNLGRATFLPLNIIKYRKLTNIDNLKSTEGYIGIASELIDYDKKFLAAIEYVIGRTIIAKDMESALGIAKKCDYSLKIVTLTGEVINPGGSLTGGSKVVKNANIIGRKREIETLLHKISETHIEIENITKNIEDNKTIIKNLEDMNFNLKDKIHSENIETTKLREKIISLENENEKLKQYINVTSYEVNSVKDNIEKLSKEASDKQVLIDELKNKEEENNSNITEFETLLSDKKEGISDVREKLTELKIKKAQISEVIANKTSEIERLLSEELELKKKCDKMTSEIREAINNKNLSNTNIEGNKKKAELLSTYFEEFKKIFEEYDMKRIKIKEDIKTYTDKLEENDLFLQKVEGEYHKLELSLARYEAEKEGLYSKLNDELELTYAEALKFRYEVTDLENLRKEIMVLKSKVSSLGTVNLGAIEEYEEIKEKFTFMSSQKEDLMKAKEELRSLVYEITDKMKEMFNENFNKLKINFNETFQELFKGGSADLILAEGDELEANIDINVQPPGKKLQNINLMSGGEKGLSAIALLFAILKMKPTPFCILDEIEAALDDANVNRYAEFLRKFSNNIQFVVITHRKGTMEASDVLYGVTMEEKGVSKIVSVDLCKA